MPGLIFVSPGTFTDAGDLPQVPPTPVLPIRGAMVDWAADRLPTGGLSSWTDMLGARTLETPNPLSQHPTVVGGGVNRRVVFDGTNDRMFVDMNMSQPVTMVIVARMPNAAQGDFLFTGGPASSQTWGLGITNSTARRWIFSTGSGSSLMSPVEQQADTNWHIFIISADGARSAMSIDGTEVEAPINPVSWETLWIGATASSYHANELRRFAAIPRATTAPERAALRQQLATHYGI